MGCCPPVSPGQHEESGLISPGRLSTVSSFTYSYGTMCRSLDESSLSERAVLTSGTGCRKTIQVGSGRPCAEIQTPTL